MTIHTAGEADVLVGAESSAAAAVELHAHTTDERGIMKMRPVDGIPVQPGEQTALAPGGYHIMLVGLTAPLEEGETIDLTLRFEKAGRVTMGVPVARSAQQVEPSHGGGYGDGHRH